MKIGYFLSCEEWGPRDLVRQAVKAARFRSGARPRTSTLVTEDAFCAAYRERVLPALV